MTTLARPSATQVNLKAVGCYVLLAYAGLWLVCSPFWLNGKGLAVLYFQPLVVVGMWMPALASILTCRFVTHEPWRARVALTLRPADGGGARRVLRGCALAIGVMLAIGVAVLALDLATGLRVDWTLQGYLHRELAALPAGASVPAGVLLLGLAANLVLGLVLINPLAALGEEIGWRGWLYPALLPLGRGPATVLTGAIWALWHAPLMLLGYNYPTLPRGLSLLLFIVPCVLLTAVLAWLRTTSGSVLSCAYAHGTFNLVGTVLLGVLPGAGARVNPALHGVIGVTGLVVLAAALVIGYLIGRRRS